MMKSSYPFKNLVFRGGGILGIAYLGALEVLDSDDNKILPGIVRVSGASAGAITALAVSLCTSAAEIKQMADTLDFTKVPEKETVKLSKMESHTDAITGHLEKAVGLKFDPADINCLIRLLKNYGWYSSNYVYEWFKTQIETKFEAKGYPKPTSKSKVGMQTFSDFKKAGFRDLYISVTNVTKHCNEIFSVETMPDMPVADAVRMSMSIPLYFESIKLNSNQYADGGTVNNYPMSVFDYKKYVSNPANFKDGINNETLGCHLYSAGESAKKPIKFGLVQYVVDLMQTLLDTQEIGFNNVPNLIKRSANISDCGISAIDFDITVGSPKYNELYSSGLEAMKKYLANYTKQ
ncbi:MAG: patatin-like phospholipase family protein [Bacteroidales bacterium]|nr:patatin-like phospholipase family protein [Bacteroidales bacterium]HPD94629.1 patatin-like phospholipase family protein [Tenuifilaceae bacterium]